MRFTYFVVALAVACGATSTTPVSTSMTVDMNIVPRDDAKLFVELCDRGDRAPILLYLHGGPGQAIGVVG